MYICPVASMNPSLKFVAIAFNDYGGIGFEFLVVLGCHQAVLRGAA